MMPKEDGNVVPCKVEVEYEWVPPKCKTCMSLGHTTAACPESKKVEKPPVAVYVQKRTSQPPVKQPIVMKSTNRTVQQMVDGEVGVVEQEHRAANIEINNKGKEVVVYNPFDAHLECSRSQPSRPSGGVKELVAEFRLQFLGLLETRVSAINVSRIQTFLPRWSWFTDYDGPGNRIWIAWDDELLDVHVLDLDIQFIHCRITIRCAHLSVLATVVYGANDTISRRGLWQKLVTLANYISDEPWIVGGDFNTVLDMSEVCGSSADIHLAMMEFRDCILDTGLIHLPVQGERFSWHNCSEGDRSLWKRLDRLIVNDAWLGQWPNSNYHCLNARTSDHSPLVIRGDTATHTVSMFRFDNYLTMSSDFTPSVQNVWRYRIEGTSMYAVTRKLRALKPVFRSLRKKKGDLSLNVKLAAEFLGKVQHLLEGDRHNALLIRLEKCCKMVFFRASKLEQNMLQQRAKIQWLKGGDQCSRIFFRKVAMRRAAKRVFQIMNEAGRTLTAHDEVVDEFVAYYQRLLGGERRREFIDLRYLQDKAPGPDGYSSGFYKAAWPVIGEEVATAILEFFTTGRLLKQVNTTILALIPKRLRLVLDKMISPSQNAFVPGRSIGDNILLAQEMFSGYNRQGLPMRCALKVDLRKAYDTVEWDFLSAVLHLFGFPDIFIGWIEECVSTPMFSVCINGNPHGFFKGSRGLRQGDPMSPFLFVLIMEVLQLMLQQLIDQNEGFSFHWRCKEIGLFQLCFADDLLLFCKADVVSVQILRHGLDEFAKLSGLHANPQKSQLILSRSAQAMREHLTAALQFQEGHLPLRETSSDQISAYVTQCLLGNGLHLPKGVIRAVEKKMRNFLWKGNSVVGYPKVAWSDVCRPIEEGGLGIRDILALNKALMSRHLWNVIQNNQSSIWVKWITHTHLRHKSVWTVDLKGGSWGWRKLLRLRSALIPYIEFKIGPSRTNIPKETKLSAVLVDGEWSWPPIMDLECIEILHLLPTIHNGNDSILWRGGEFNTKVVYDIFRIPGPIVGWYPLLLGPCKIPRYSFVLWLAILEKLSTMDKPWLSHLGGVCVFCGREVETHEHLFFRCSYSRRCVRDLKATVRFSWPNRAWRMDITWATKRWKGRHIVQAAYRAYYQLLFTIFGGNVIKEFFSTVSGRAPLLLGLL
ncbi:UNVERIFIED_CONTAM: putative ribonuclease H protein [Sesamum calycinum]|uniref:Ribonuclease H protein n=1 Tax=Sesamum calycinum TaxID=2727403 RepID=A0AAW2JM28_9LAMI